MATFTNLNYIAQSVAEVTGKSFDIPFLRMVEREILAKRSTLIRQDFTKDRSLYHQMVQDISCTPMEKADSGECCEGLTGCKVTRSVQTVPQPVRFKSNTSPFVYVGGIDKSTPYGFTAPENIPYLVAGRRFKTKNLFYYAYLNNRIYVFSLFGKDAVKKINIRGVFSDPLELENLKDCNGESCYVPGNLPIPLDMEAAIKKLIYAELSMYQPSPPKEITIDETQAQS